MKGNLYLLTMMRICGIVIKVMENLRHGNVLDDMLGLFVFIVVFNTLYWCGVGI